MAINPIAAAAITATASLAGKLLFRGLLRSKIVFTAPKEEPVVAPTPSEPVKVPEVKVVRPTVRAVRSLTDPERNLSHGEACSILSMKIAMLAPAMQELAARKAAEATFDNEQLTESLIVGAVMDQAVKQDDQAQVTAALLGDVREHFADSDLLFWDNFVERIKVRGQVVVATEQELLNKKDTGKGYHLVTLTETQEVGIMHVTKKAVNALFPQGNGTFRVVGSTKRFEDKPYVDAAKAKGFLNGRY